MNIYIVRKNCKNVMSASTKDDFVWRL